MNENVQRLVYWIKERYKIYTLKTAGAAKPWTKDPILQKYKFCNVYREFDTETKWIAENWRTLDHPDLWFAMVIARLINNHHMLKMIKPLPWNRDLFLAAVENQRAAGKRVFSGAYIVSTNGEAMDKPLYLAENVLQPMWEQRAKLRPRPGDTCESIYTRLRSFRGMGSFMAGQVIADTKFTIQPRPKDFWTFAVSGPGSRRGLNRVLGRSFDSPWIESLWYDKLLELALEIEKPLTELPTLSLQDLQNCLCEFDKYERTRLGQGRPRSTYPGVR